jgi:hypothetical protein
VFIEHGDPAAAGRDAASTPPASRPRSASTAALWALDVTLPAEQKGTHMSRFVAWLEDNTEPLDAATLRARHAQMLDKLHATDGRIEAAFSFFLKKRAPVSGLQSLLDYQGRWIAETRGGVTSIWAEVGVPVKSLCPCSKEISDYGAHNQRSLVTIRVELLRGGRVARTGALCRGRGQQRDLADAQAQRREVGHRACLREPQIRRGPGARRRAAPEPGRAHRALCGGRREFRVDPQSFCLCPHRAGIGAGPTGRPRLRRVNDGGNGSHAAGM